MLDKKLLFATALIAACGLVFPAAGQRSTAAPRSVAVAPVAAADKGWDGTIKGKQILTPVEIAFADPESYDNFAAGRLPIGFVLRNSASGQTIRLDPRWVTETFRPGRDKSKAVVYIVVGGLDAPIWDERGCTATRTGVESAAGGTGVTITLTYAPCSGPPMAMPGNPIGNIIVKGGRSAAQSRTADPPVDCTKLPAGDPRCPQFGVTAESRTLAAAADGGRDRLNCWIDPLCGIILGVNASVASPGAPPIIGVGVVVKKNPGGGASRVVVTTGGSQTGENLGARLAARLRETGASSISVPDVNNRGAGSPKNAGF